jgi:hypothetical protein
MDLSKADKPETSGVAIDVPSPQVFTKNSPQDTEGSEKRIDKGLQKARRLYLP